MTQHGSYAEGKVYATLGDPVRTPTTRLILALAAGVLVCTPLLPAFGQSQPVPRPPGAHQPNPPAAPASFKTLWAVLSASGLATTLTGKGPFTLFAPTDQAFAALPPGTVEELLKPEHKATLLKLLSYHVVPAALTSKTLPAAVKTVEGQPLKIQVDAQRQAKVNNASVILPDVRATNGVIHVIDRVMLPPDILTP